MSPSVGRTIDLNADLGEGSGRWPQDDAALLDVVSSANVACGFHAGNPLIMQATVRMAAERGVAIGAHPGYRDLEGFGRRDLGASAGEILADVLYQIGALAAFCRLEGVPLHYVKPHGALYNRASRDPEAAGAIVAAVRAANPSLALLALPGSALARAGTEAGLRVIREAFLDRGYLPDGTLVPRGSPNALLNDPLAATARAVRILEQGLITAVTGEDIAIESDTLCVHGDGPAAAAILSSVRRGLEAAGFSVRAFAP